MVPFRCWGVKEFNCLVPIVVEPPTGEEAAMARAGRKRHNSIDWIRESCMAEKLGNPKGRIISTTKMCVSGYECKRTDVQL